jgi:hypothetical protein
MEFGLIQNNEVQKKFSDNSSFGGDYNLYISVSISYYCESYLKSSGKYEYFLKEYLFNDKFHKKFFGPIIQIQKDSSIEEYKHIFETCFKDLSFKRGYDLITN